MGSPRDDDEDMLKTQDLFLGLMMPPDDMLTNQSGEDEQQDQFLQELRHIAGRPDPSLMQDYRLPIKQDIDFQLHTDDEKF